MERLGIIFIPTAKEYTPPQKVRSLVDLLLKRAMTAGTVQIGIAYHKASFLALRRVSYLKEPGLSSLDHSQENDESIQIRPSALFNFSISFGDCVLECFYYTKLYNIKNLIASYEI